MKSFPAGVQPQPANPEGFMDIMTTSDNIIFVYKDYFHFYHNDDTFYDSPFSIQSLEYVRRDPYKKINKEGIHPKGSFFVGEDFYRQWFSLLILFHWFYFKYTKHSRHKWHS